MQGLGGQVISHVPATSDELIETYRRSGRPEDFEQIVRRFAALVLSECRRVTHNAHDAEDASQLVFLALAIEIKSGNSIRRLSPWLQRVARRQALKLVRSRTRLQRRENAARRSEIETPNGDHALDTAVSSGIVRDAIDELPERYRLPVILHYFGGMSLARIAQELRISRPAVATRLHRGRKMLETRLAQRGMRLENGTLAAVLAILVPTGVIKNIVTSAGGMRMPIHGAGLTAAVGDVLRTVALAGMRRPLVAVTVLTSLACGGSAMAWAIHAAPAVIQEILHLDAPNVFEQLLPTRVPTLHATAPSQKLQAPPAGNASFANTSSPRITATNSNTRLPAPPSIAQQILTAPPVAPVATSEGSPRINTKQLATNDFNLQITPQTAAQSTNSVDFVVGTDPNKTERFLQDGTTIAVNKLTIGDTNSAEYTLKNAHLEADTVTIGAKPNSTGTLTITNADLTLTNPNSGIVIGAEGNGKLFLGDENAPGFIGAGSGGGGASVIVGESPGSFGLIQGHGKIDTGGTFTNNGVVVGDGFNHKRPLDLSGQKKITTTPGVGPNGQKGWYVQRGGEIKLPTIPIQPGTHGYVWGDDVNATTPSLVNSMRLTVHDQPTSANLDVTLRTIALDDPLDIILPTQVSIVGLWQFDSDTLDPTAIDVLLRYNDSAANIYYPGESGLELLAHENGKWQLADNLSRDELRHLIYGEFDGNFDYLAVVVPWLTSDSTSMTLLPQGVTPAPEPAGLALIAAAASLLLRRRRRGA